MKHVNGAVFALWLALACVPLAGCGDDDFALSPAPSPTPTPAVGPAITFFGVTRSDDTLVLSSGRDVNEVPIYSRQFGSGFSLVVEGRPGRSGAPVGTSAFREDLTSLPDLQVQVSRPLGNGSAAVCDASRDLDGGVPAISPPSFDPTPHIIGVVNDLACRFRNGTGNPVGRDSTEACVMFPTGDFGFVDSASTIQFCGFITSVLEFPPGDTLVTARLRDEEGNAGPLARILIRIRP